MLSLVFVQEKLPRTMKRSEWRAVHRWRRETQKQLKAAAEREAEAFRHLVAEMATVGSANCIVGVDRMLDGIVHPRLLVVPYEDTLRSVDIRPAGLNYV